MRHAQQRQQVGPPIGFEHGGVEVVVQLAQHRHQSLLVDGALLRAQRLARAQLLQHVVHPGQSQAGMRGLLALAVGVQFLGQAANALGRVLARDVHRTAVAVGVLRTVGDRAAELVGRVEVREGERFKARGLVVNRSILKCCPCRQGPHDMNL
jgi:hypothetical protein